ncbi:DUF3298 and DUF4163 domain-containing protein [Niallia sp. Sow4_A1]|uniref:DUF3298 and DUF4163 domain-containing protein n=1 Tax=Niallia hominis TaxID=3133173 RepID=A0ABV1F5B1_9BACI|nr:MULTISPECIES: DUF3298 and DUF4163 domain-containing protein [Bacillaceae]MCF2649473.1 DUF3298 and DUF4163 domain-containing protein [Niallia circulans]MCM3363814.1 DUF3298 and DUF4163 domain-containing protein [Niallia sp. MER TA 168]CAI9391825.1 hypothetical protein BACSP_03136 [Bacillus sp. T2.9-1]
MKKQTNLFILTLSVLHILIFTIQPIPASAIKTPNVVMTKQYKNIENLKYPTLISAPNNKAQNQVNKILLQHIKHSYKRYFKWMKEMEKMKTDPICKESPSVCKFEYITNYKVKFNSNNKLSIIFNDYQFTGGAHGNTVISSYNFDLKSGNQLTLDDFLTSEREYEKVTNYALAYMKKHPEIFYSDSTEFADFKVTNETNFFLSDKGIVLIFQQYEVGPYVSGNPSILIPTSVFQ